MSTFEYKKIEISETKKLIFTSLKMIFRRPFYSFLPFFALSLMFILLLKINIIFSIVVMFVLGLSIMPILTFELTYSNDYSKIPFRMINYFKDSVMKKKYLSASPAIIFLLSCLFVFLVLNDLSEEGKELISSFENNESHIYLAGYIFLFIISRSIGSLSVKYNLSICLIFIPYLNQGLNKEILYLKEYEYRKNNTNKIEVLMTLLIFTGAAITFTAYIFSKSLLFCSVLWSIFSTFQASFIYLLAKYICGEGAKLEEKKKVVSFGNSKIKTVKA